MSGPIRVYLCSSVAKTPAFLRVLCAFAVQTLYSSARLDIHPGVPLSIEGDLQLVGVAADGAVFDVGLGLAGGGVDDDLDRFAAVRAGVFGGFVH